MIRNSLIFFGIAMLLLFAGCINNYQTEEKTNSDVVKFVENKENQKEENATNAPNVISKAELSKHNKRSDCWILIHGKVYNVTGFIYFHPGGEAILQGCGKDATQLFETRPMGSRTPHSEKARELLKKYYIGEIER